jgi:hypothetical protein
MKKLVLQKSCSSKQNSQHCFVEDMLRTEFREFSSIFVPRNEIPSCFLLCRTEFREFASIFVPWYRILSIFSPLRNGSERNSESFLFRGTAGTNQLFRLFRLPRNNFLSDIANPSCDPFLLLCPLRNSSSSCRQTQERPVS